MKEIQIRKNDAGQRLDRFVGKAVPLLPESLLQKYIRLKRIKRNGKGTKRDVRLVEGDVLQLYINDEFFDKPNEENLFLTVFKPQLNIVYEDENLLLGDKRPGMSVHADETEKVNTLINHIQAYLYQKREWNPKWENAFAPALCNRLDRGTEGLVLAAKSYAALRDLNAIIRDDMMKKEYLTITVGAPPQGRFVAWLQHSEKNNKVRIHARESEGYKQIITEVTVIRQAGPFALCRIGLITGRTHQIRAHLAYLGHPVLGDIKYGNRKMNERTGLKTQALCAQRLTFGRIPEENTLQYLSGRVIKLNDPEIVKTYERLTAEK